MPKGPTASDTVDVKEYLADNQNKLANHEISIDRPVMGSDSAISSHNPLGYNLSKNGLIASALEIPNSVCLSFEHVDQNVSERLVEDGENPDLSAAAPKELCTDNELGSIKSEDHGKSERPQSGVSNETSADPKQYNEVLIDGFSILSFESKQDLLEYTKLCESRNPRTVSMIEQTCKRARRCGVPKRKRTKAFLKQTLSQTSTPNDLLRHHHHHHHNHHNHHPSKKQQPSDHHSICSYKSHYQNNHLSPSVHLSPKNETSVKLRITNNVNNSLVSTHSSSSSSNSNNNSDNNTHNRLHNVNDICLNKESNHIVQHLDASLSNHNPYSFTTSLPTITTITSIPSTSSSINHSRLITSHILDKTDQIYSKENIQSPEYSSMSPLNHSSMNMSSPHDYRLMSSSGVWNSQMKIDSGSPQKGDKTTYTNNWDSHNGKMTTTTSIPDNGKLSEPVSKSHRHLFSVAALTDEVTYSPDSNEHKPQVVLSKSPKCTSTKKRTYRKSEQRDVCTHNKYSKSHNDYDKSVVHSKPEYYIHTNRCSNSNNNINSSMSSHLASNDMLKGGVNSANRIPEEVHDSVLKYPSLSCGQQIPSNHDFQKNKIKNREDMVNMIPPFSHNPSVSTLPGHVYKPPRELFGPLCHNSQLNQFQSISSPQLPLQLVSSSLCSNPFLSHQNLLKQFMGIDSETANQLFSDPRFMEFYALTMAKLSGNSGGGDSVHDSISSTPRTSSIHNHENVNSICNNNNNNNQNNTINQTRNGSTNGHSRSDPSLFKEATLSHYGQVNSSGFQNKLYPYSNMTSVTRVPAISGTGSSTSCISASSSTNRLLPPNSETNPQIARSHAVVAAAYADREFISNPQPFSKTKTSQGTNSSSFSSSSIQLPPINVHSASNRNVQHFSMPNSSLYPGQRNNLCPTSHSTGSLESTSNLHNPKSNSTNVHPSSSSSYSSSEMMVNKHFGSYSSKLPNGDPHNPPTSITHDDRNVGLHKPEYLPSGSLHRSDLPFPLPPFPSHIPPEFLKPFFAADSSSYPGSKPNFTSNSTFIPSNQHFQSLQSMYFPMRGVNPTNRIDKTNYSGLLHRPVHADKLCGRWADAHIRIALFIQHCKSLQRSQSSPIISKIYPMSRLPIRPVVRRLNLVTHSPIASTMNGPVNCNSSRSSNTELINSRSVNVPTPVPPTHLSQVNNNNNNNSNGSPSDVSFWGHLFNEFMNNLSKEFVNNMPDCKNTQMAMIQNFYLQMSQFTSSLGCSSNLPDFPFFNSSVASSLASSSSMCIGSTIGNLSFPLYTQSNLHSSSSIRSSFPPTVSAPLNFNSQQGLLNTELKRRRTDSSSMDSSSNIPFSMRFPIFPRLPNLMPGSSHHHHHHQQQQQQHSTVVSSTFPPSLPPAHSNVINATTNLLNGFRLPETLLNRPHPLPSGSSTMNDTFPSSDNNSRPSNAASHLVPINPW
ncbi:unnamed protein product [Heterobilharzia americana]|nr:unnamed protein product [Heterobilharzia americana]